MKEKLLVVIPCGGAKIWKKEPDHGPIKAKFAYTGSPFKVNKKFAEKFADKWVILSAKYGFIDPDFVIPENYNVTFNKPSTNPIKLETLRRQVLEKSDFQGFDFIIALGGKAYISIIEQIFSEESVIVPTRGMSLFDQTHEVSSLTKLRRNEMLKRIGVLDE